MTQKIILGLGGALAIAAAALTFSSALVPFASQANTASSTEPVISNIVASSTDTTATVSWTTDLAATSQVEYGTTTSYGAFSALNDSPTGVTNHFIVITGLTPNTTYHFAVLSMLTGSTSTSTATTTSADQFFVTALASSTTSTTTASTSVPLKISNVVVSPTQTGATITWLTDQAASSQVAFGLSANYNASTTLNNTQVTSHLSVLSGLTPHTLYHFEIISGNSSSTATTTDATFMTLTATSTEGADDTGTTTVDDDSALQNEITTLQNRVGSLEGEIIGLLSGQGGSSTPSTGPAFIEQNGQTFTAGTSIDFGGRNFGHEENVVVTLSGQTVTTAHADGGGNFSTGSLPLPPTPGTYIYTFTGQHSSTTVQATIHLI